jgi:miniconductance mechanosensitive channel
MKDQEIENLKRIQLLTSYIQNRQDEIAKYNSTHNVDKTIAINGRNMTNFGLFRKYITQYLHNHPGLNKDMILLCRQLQPTQNGIPLEIYAFSNDKKFENYEYIMSDIFDHIFASIKYFDLEICEMPNAIDVTK